MRLALFLGVAVFVGLCLMDARAVEEESREIGAWIDRADAGTYPCNACTFADAAWKCGEATCAH